MLQGGGVIAEYGPMRLVISASVGKVPQREMGVRAAEESFRYFERVASQRDQLARRLSRVPEEMEDLLAVRMVQSVLGVGDQDLTPMAAVAGTIGDAVADFLFDRGMSKVMVDNGGDVSVRIRGAGPVRVGTRTEVAEKEISHVIVLGPDRSSWGIATSGLGGRSLTRGVASAVTVIAERSSLADAAATAVANASFIEDDQVVQCLAEEIDPNTDIAGLPVTVKVGPLSEEKKEIAVFGALRRAEDLLRSGLILGALVAVQGRVGMTDFFRERLAKDKGGFSYGG